MTLIADFLAGSLLTLLLPVALLVALVVWYLLFLRRVPEPTLGEEAAAVAAHNRGPAGSGAPAAAPNPGPAAPGAGAPPETSDTPREA